MSKIGTQFDRLRRHAATISITTWDLWERADFHSTLVSAVLASIQFVKPDRTHSQLGSGRRKERHSGEAKRIAESGLDSGCMKMHR